MWTIYYPNDFYLKNQHKSSEAFWVDIVNFQDLWNSMDILHVIDTFKDFEGNILCFQEASILAFKIRTCNFIWSRYAVAKKYCKMKTPTFSFSIENK